MAGSGKHMKRSVCHRLSHQLPRVSRFPSSGMGQVGKATSSTWSPTLKKMIALATVQRGATKPGTRLQFEITVEAVRHRVGARRQDTPLQSEKRKTATPAY